MDEPNILRRRGLQVNRDCRASGQTGMIWWWWWWWWWWYDGDKREICPAIALGVGALDSQNDLFYTPLLFTPCDNDVVLVVVDDLSGRVYFQALAQHHQPIGIEASGAHNAVYEFEGYRAELISPPDLFMFRSSPLVRWWSRLPWWQEHRMKKVSFAFWPTEIQYMSLWSSQGYRVYLS